MAAVSCCCFTHLEQSITTRHFSTISADFQEDVEAVIVLPQFPVLLFSIGLCSRPIAAAFGLNALFVNYRN